MRRLLTIMVSAALVVSLPKVASAQCDEECGEVSQGGTFIGWICLSGNQGNNCETTTEYCAIHTSGCGGASEEFISDAEGTVKAVAARCATSNTIVELRLLSARPGDGSSNTQVASPIARLAEFPLLGIPVSGPTGR